MGQRTDKPDVSESIDEFFEPLPGDTLDDSFDDEAPMAKTESRIAQLRRRAEERLEKTRMQQELDYIDLDWEE